MNIFDSSLKKKVELETLHEGQVRIYICGPTVYDDAHLGHARSAISFDLLIRVLETLNFKVLVAKNFTDIDDKLILKSKQTGMSLNDISNKYIESYLSDMKSLNVRPANIEPRVTEHLESIRIFIEELLKKGFAYKLNNGDIYLEVSKDKCYGTLSGHIEALKIESINEISNESEINKRDIRDFALWKAYKGNDDVGFDLNSDLIDKGRPGWHIECSSMIDSILAYEDKEYCIDIHAGGSDLFFPHHENEASQTRCCKGKNLAKYWMHNGFVNMNGEKMSKSLGNSFFIKDALKFYHGEILRNYLIGVHYRASFNFNEEDLLVSKKRLDKIYRLKKRINYSSIINTIDDFDTVFKTEFLEQLRDDLNISTALSVLEDFLKTSNEILNQNIKNKHILKKKTREIATNLKYVDSILGFGTMNEEEYFQLGVDSNFKETINKALRDRIEAKLNKDYEKADLIRKNLEKHGITLMDKPNNVTEWEKII